MVEDERPIDDGGIQSVKTRAVRAVAGAQIATYRYDDGGEMDFFEVLASNGDRLSIPMHLLPETHVQGDITSFLETRGGE